TNLDGGRGTLRAFDANDGTELWTVPNIGNTEAGSPIVYDNLVIVGSADTPIIKAFNKSNGKLVWETDNGSLMLNSGSISGNGNLYITDLSSNLKIYDVYSGELLRMISLNYSSTNGV
ncbi:PQQ-binding-like beta-propeller repeat protein, partial [Microvirga sp. 3-52]|nr:PQQ-binding-like beta-propeller repeat protein [Microvirga sp. 3-52]